MSILTLIGFLLGHRKSILRIAACPNAHWLGLLFVLSAGFARGYDGEDLLHEPWHLLIPVVASLATSFVLFCLLWVMGRGWSWLGGFWINYRMFLGLYWMTAPIAWLYAIPVERHMLPAEAVEANLWLLAIVAGWRVLLMIRVVAVLFGSTAGAAFTVMCFANVVTLAVLRVTPLPVFSLMGGIRLSESEEIIQVTAFLVGAFSVITFPIWLIGMLGVAITRFHLAEPEIVVEENKDATPGDAEKPVSWDAWTLAALSLAVWGVVLPFTQLEQLLRHSVEADLRSGQIRRALETMSAHAREDFPPHWDPPPRVGYGERTPPLLEVVPVLLAAKASPWVQEVFFDKYERQISQGFGPYHVWIGFNDQEFERHVAVLEQLPDDSPIVERQRRNLNDFIQFLPNERQQRLRQALGVPELEPEPAPMEEPSTDAETQANENTAVP